MLTTVRNSVDAMPYTKGTPDLTIAAMLQIWQIW